MKGNVTAQQIKSMLKNNKPGYYAVGNGLYLRISGERTGFWVIRYSIHSKRREISIGSYPEMSLADAGAETTLLKKNLKEGIDPQAEKKRADKTEFHTVEDLAQDWIKDLEKRLKHPRIPRRIYQKDIAPFIGELAIDQITPRDIRGIINKITDSGRRTVSNDALLYCKQLFRHAIKLDLIAHNPAEAFSISDAGGVEKSRNRFLALKEIKTVFQVLNKYPDQFSRENFLAVALLLSLGVRKGELIAAQWIEFDFRKKLWHIPESRSKTGVAITVPLADEVIVWFDELRIRSNRSDYVFPNRRVSKRFGHISMDTLNAAIQKLFREKKLSIKHFTVHDLRRTCRSLLASEGVPGHIAERCLNHKLKGVEGIYDRYDYLDERREALDKIVKKIAPLVDLVAVS